VVTAPDMGATATGLSRADRATAPVANILRGLTDDSRRSTNETFQVTFRYRNGPPSPMYSLGTRFAQLSGSGVTSAFHDALNIGMVSIEKLVGRVAELPSNGARRSCQTAANQFDYRRR
jgi:hypothetical protein